MTIFNCIKNEIKNHRDEIKEIVLDPDVFSKKYFRKLQNDGFNIRWMNEDEQKEEPVAFFIKSRE